VYLPPCVWGDTVSDPSVDDARSGEDDEPVDGGRSGGDGEPVDGGRSGGDGEPPAEVAQADGGEHPTAPPSVTEPEAALPDDVPTTGDLGAEGRTETLDPSAEETMASQSGITFGGSLISKAFGFLIVALITRLVSPGVYGLFVLATAVLHLMQVFASAGLHRAIDYFVPQYLDADEPGKARAVTLQVFGLLLLTSGTTALVLYLSADRIALFFDEPGLATALRYLALALPLLAMFNGLMASYNGLKRLKYRVYVRDVTRPTVRLFATSGLLVATGLGLIGVIGGYLAGLVIAISLGAVILLRQEALRGGELSLTPFREILWYGLPLALAGVIFVVMGQVDNLILGFFLESDDVGIYRVGYMLAGNLLIFFSSLAPVFKPLIAEERKNGDAVAERYRTATRWVLGLSLPVAAILVLGAEVYLSIVFTPQYTVASGVVLALVVGYIVSILGGGPDGALLQGLGYSRLVFLNSGILLLGNVFFTALLVPQYGIIGAGLGTMAALALSGSAALMEVYYYRRIHPFSRALGRVVLAWLPALAAGWLVVAIVPDQLLIAVVLPVVVIGVYIAAGRAVGAVTPEDVLIAEAVAPDGVADRIRRATDEK